MKKFQPDWYASPIALPERTSGKLSIVHRQVAPGETLPIVGMRQALLTGQRPLTLRVNEPLVVHQLVEDGRGVWMTDLPEELNQIMAMLHTMLRPFDRVLVGGLGLGILPAILAQADNLVTVVERDRDVVALCARPEYTTVVADIYEYVKVCERFDTFLLDTWQLTSESAWWSEVLPLRRTLRQRFGARPRIWCWAEDIMRGQVERSLQWGKGHWYYTGLPAMSPVQARQFVRQVGAPAWEKAYGEVVDANFERMAEQRAELEA